MTRTAVFFWIAFAAAPATRPAQTLSHPAIATAAQSSTATQSPVNPAIITIGPNIPNSCPVGLSAKPGIGGNVLTIAAGDGTGSQTLNLELNNTGSHHITAAEITVHGITARAHIVPASNSQDANTATKQVNLDLTVAPGATTSRSLLFKGFTSITLIDLYSLTYADGSSWHASPHQTCSIIPNRVMLVDNH